MNVIITNKCESIIASLDIDVIKSMNGIFTVQDIASQFQNYFYNRMIIDITAIQKYEDINTIQELAMALDSSKMILLLDDSPVVNSPMYLSQLVSMGIFNFTNSTDNLKYLIDNPNTYKDVAHYQKLNASGDDFKQSNQQSLEKSLMSQRIIGVKNLTEHAGSTTLSYLLKKHLEVQYKVKAVELNGHDYELIDDSDLISISSKDIQSFISENSSYETIVIDLNDTEITDFCTDVIYLIEPGSIPLNKMIRKNNFIFDDMKGQKIVLNKSLLNEQKVEDFEREARCKIFFNVPYVDDRDVDIKEINDLLLALGYTRFGNKEEKKGSIFGGLFH